MKQFLCFLFFFFSFYPLQASPEVGAVPDDSLYNLLERREPFKLTGFSLGPKWLLSHKPSSSEFFSLTFSGHREVMEQAEVNYRLSGAFNAKVTGWDVSATIGSSYFFLKGNISPYLGLDFGFGLMSFLHEGERHIPFGFVGAFRIGARFFRLSENQLDISLANGFMFRNIEGSFPISLDLKVTLLI